MADASAQTLALALGVSALVTVACRRVRIPALLPLMLVGMGLGASGVGLVETDSLGPALKGFITVAIGLLIYEGALHLNKEELSRAPRAVWGLLTIGAITTWCAASLAGHYILGFGWPLAVLLGATLIVTGPTVVQPILRLVRVSPRAHTALSAEAILIDPLGVVATITTLEVIRALMATGPDLELARAGVWLFVKPLIGGAGIGLLSGVLGLFLLRAASRAGKVDPSILNLLAIGVCMTCVGVGEAITPEAGLAAVTICGVIMARARVLGATELRAFKELLAVMLVGTLFILLSSRFDVAQLQSLTWRDGVFVLALILVIRPLAVALSTWGSRLSIQERVFAGTFAPRGIVALSVAAIAAAELASLPTQAGTSQQLMSASDLAADAARLELVMFTVIFGSVLLACTLSPLLVFAMGIKAGQGSSLIIVGGHPLSVALANALARHGVESRIIDSNEQRAAAAEAAGVDAVVGDATDTRWMDDVGSPHGAGWLLAWTGNHDVDQLAARWAQDRFGDQRAIVWSNRPARGRLETADIGEGEPITDWLDRFGDGLVRIQESRDPQGCGRLLCWITDGRLTLAAPGAGLPSASPSMICLGIKEGGAVPAHAAEGGAMDRRPR